MLNISRDDNYLCQCEDFDDKNIHLVASQNSIFSSFFSKIKVNYLILINFNNNQKHAFDEDFQVWARYKLKKPIETDKKVIFNYMCLKASKKLVIFLFNFLYSNRIIRKYTNSRNI